MAVFGFDPLVMYVDGLDIHIVRTSGAKLPMNPLKNLIWRQQ